jgi:ribonucleoside-diphosphate reductase alpha chain
MTEVATVETGIATNLTSLKMCKRNGEIVDLDVNKIRRTMERACEGLDGCTPSALEAAFYPQVRDGMTTKELMKVLIQAAVEKTSVEEPNWQYVAARQLLFDCYKEAAQSRVCTVRNREFFRGNYTRCKEAK